MIQLTENIFATPLKQWVDIDFDFPESKEYEFLFDSDSVDEEKAKMVVEKVKTNSGVEYFDYVHNIWLYNSSYTESFKSLLQSKNLTTGNYAILLNK